MAGSYTISKLLLPAAPGVLGQRFVPGSFVPLHEVPAGCTPTRMQCLSGAVLGCTECSALPGSLCLPQKEKDFQERRNLGAWGWRMDGCSQRCHPHGMAEGSVSVPVGSKLCFPIPASHSCEVLCPGGHAALDIST